MLIFIVVLIALAVAVEVTSLRDTLVFMRYAADISKPLVDPGETFELVSVFENMRRLPLPFLDVQEILPPEIVLDLKNVKTHYAWDNDAVIGDRTLRLRSTVYLLPRQRLVRRIPASLPDRGRYLLRGAVVRRGDFLGLRESYRDFPCRAEIVVVPAPAADCPAFEALGNFLGDISVRRFTMEDPVLTLGFSDYTGREPRRDISWVQSARLGRMMVKKYDYTLEPAVTVVLNVSCNDELPAAALLERCFSLTRTVCEKLEAARIKYRVLSNASPAGLGGRWPQMADGLGQSHLYGILESLGRATYDSAEPFEKTLERAIRTAEHGRSHIIITPVRTGGLEAGVARLRLLTGGEAVVLEASCEEDA